MCITHKAKGWIRTHLWTITVPHRAVHMVSTRLAHRKATVRHFSSLISRVEVLMKAINAGIRVGQRRLETYTTTSIKVSDPMLSESPKSITVTTRKHMTLTPHVCTW